MLPDDDYNSALKFAEFQEQILRETIKYVRIEGLDYYVQQLKKWDKIINDIKSKTIDDITVKNLIYTKNEWDEFFVRFGRKKIGE